MKKVLCNPRDNWQEKCDNLGFYFHSVDGRYWVEEYGIEFNQKEKEELYKVTYDLNQMCLDLASDIVKNGDYHYYGLPVDVSQEIETSWKNKDFNLYSRFDLSYDGLSPPKLLEYNADTPTCLIESANVQKAWQEELFPQYDQFNDVEKNLIKRWEEFKKVYPNIENLHFTSHVFSQEDWCNAEFIRECAVKAGINTHYLSIQDIGWDYSKQKFCDDNSKNIDYLFKIHPWEMLILDEFYPHIKRDNITIIEPMWKMLLSSKAILPLLWKKYPNHPNLLPAFFTEEEMLKVSNSFVKKPLLSRDGANVLILDNENIIDSEGGFYGGEGFIYQKRKDVVCFDNRYSMIGSWLFGDEPSGLSIREDYSIITKSTSWFVPHYVK